MLEKQPNLPAGTPWLGKTGEIDVPALAANCNYLNLPIIDSKVEGHGHTTLRAIGLAMELQKWADSEGDGHPIAHVHVSHGALCLMLGDVAVWDSETDNEETLNDECCIACYWEYAKLCMRPFEKAAPKQTQ
jgi:hypothetical protein